MLLTPCLGTTETERFRTTVDMTLPVDVTFTISSYPKQTGLQSDVFEIVFSPPDRSFEMDVVHMEIVDKGVTNARRLLQSSETYRVGCLWRSGSNNSWVPFERVSNHTLGNHTYSMNATRRANPGEPRFQFALLSNPESEVVPIYSVIEGGAEVQRGANTNVKYVDDVSKCTFTFKVGQNQLQDGTVVTAEKVDPSTAVGAGPDQKLYGAIVQVNSTQGLIREEYAYGQWACEEESSARRLLDWKDGTRDTCKVSIFDRFLISIDLQSTSNSLK